MLESHCHDKETAVLMEKDRCTRRKQKMTENADESFFRHFIIAPFDFSERKSEKILKNVVIDEIL